MINRALSGTLLRCIVGSMVLVADLTVPASVRAQLSEDADQRIKNIVVMLSCRTEDMDDPGAGFIFGIDDNRIYIASAAHVVAKCMQPPHVPRVRFRWSSNDVDASVIQSSGRPLDLAVLAVPRTVALAGRQQAMSFDILGDPAALRPGDPVYALGRPRGINWGVNATPDSFAGMEDDIVLFASTFLGLGHSGGVLLNDRGQIVAMIRSDQGATGEAVSITRVLAALREWKHPVSLRLPAVQLITGNDRTCRLRPDGGTACWGDMGFNRGPYMDTVRFEGMTFRQVGSGISHICGLALDGLVYCCGANEAGQLGTGNTTNSYEETVAVQQGALEFVSLTVGGWHNCALTSRGRAYCWGSGEQGRLGNDSNDDSLIPAPVAGGLTFKALSAGWSNTCGLTAGGEVYCWGGIQGTGMERFGSDPPIFSVPKKVASVPKFKLVSSGGGHVCAITASGQAYCWGANERGQLGNGAFGDGELQPVPVTGGLTFATISASLGTTCGVTIDGVAYCWGENGNGQLGNGSTTASSVPMRVSGPLTFASITASTNHTCAMTVDGEPYCWGSKGFGFGTGSRDGSTEPQRVSNMP